MEQADLSGFGGGGRPADEAAAVADDEEQVSTVVDADSMRFPDAEGAVTVTVTQVDYTVEYRGDDEFPVVHVFGRTEVEDGHPELEHIEVYDFEPYFYVPIDDVDAETIATYDGLVDYRETDENGEPFESIRGERLAKIVGRTPRDVGQVRDDFDHYEADILFPNRLLIDKDIKSGVRVPERRTSEGTIRIPHQEVEAVEANTTPRINFFDIEVDDRNGFPEDGEEPIVCLTSHDSYRDEYVAWLYQSPAGVDGPAALDAYEPIEDDFEADVRIFEEEEAMLEAFVDYIRETSPDVMSGWNFADFDAPYLLDRMEELQSSSHDYDLDIDRLSRVDEVWRSDWNGPDVKGRVVFDLLRAYKATQFSELESYRLDAVGEVELGVGKERYPGDIGDLWEDDPERLLEYNLRDVELCVELDRKQNIVAFFEEVASFVGCKLEDAPTAGDAVDMYVLHKAYGEFALPSKGTVESGEEFEGGAVFEPITGVRENVSVLDLASLYPMCMWTTNASPETKVDPDEYDGDTYRTPTGQHFRTEPDGMMREMIDELLSEREEKKELRNSHDPGSEVYERYDRQQASVKVVMNCFTPDTDVLTPAGIRSITDLDVGDEVYSLDPETMRMEVKPVVETHAYPDYDGELVNVETSKIDFSVTPNHRMLVRKDDTNGITEDTWDFVEAGELHDYCNYELPHDWEFNHADELSETTDIVELARENTDVDLTISDGGSMAAAKFGTPSIHREIDTDVLLEFLAWFITEGSTYEAETKNYRIKIAQEDDDNRDRIQTVVDHITDYHYDSGRGVSFSSRIWYELLEALCGDSSKNKQIPELVFNSSREQKWAFLTTLIAGDGDRQVNSWRFSTSSDQLRDDVLRLCAHLGLTTNYTKDSGSWRIHCSKDEKNSLRMYRSGKTSHATNGVYCVSVEENETLLAGRNGKFQFVGNSLYGVSGWDRFRLYDKDSAAAVTATGREVINYTQETVNEFGYDVIYGDTDSIMISLSDMSVEDVIENSFALEERINDSYDDFAREELDATDHRFQIEFEKLYRRFFQAGKKKRYAGHIVWKEGKDVDDIDITGFEYQRSDIAPITKEVQLQVIEMIVHGEDLDDVKDYVHDVIGDFEDGEVSLDEIGIPGGIGKKLDNYDTDTAQVRGAKYANLLLGTNFGNGSKPKRLYLKKVHPSFFREVEAELDLDPAEDPLYGEFKRDPDVICFEYEDQIPEEFEVDWDKMLEKTLRGPIARILEALDVSWEEVKSGQEQTGLSSFM